MCVCVCVRNMRPCLCPFTTEISTHTRHAKGNLRKKFKKIMHQVPSRGANPSIKFPDDANATHSTLFKHTLTPVLYRLYVSLSFRKASSNQIFLADGTYSSSAFVSLQILIAFAPNPTYTFSVPSATQGVCQFLSKKKCKDTIRIHSAHPGPRSKDCT